MGGNEKIVRVFLTGISGYLGGVLAEHFSGIPKIEHLTGIDVSPPKKPLPKKTRFVQMDVRSPEISAVMAGHDVVVHTAFVVLWPAKMSATERDDINVNGTRNVATAAVANRVKRLVYSSSDAAYDQFLLRGQTNVTEDFPLGKGNFSSYYCNAKANIERMLTATVVPAGITLTMFRPGYIIGPRNTATIQSLRENAVTLLGHDPRSQYVHEGDVAAAFAQAVLTDMPGAYNLDPDDYLQLSQVQKIIGVKHAPTIPSWLARLIMHVSWRYSGSPTHPSWLDVMLVDFTLSNLKLKATGWKPKHNSSESLRSAMVS
jgi:nucleoside-diphosphate-sugar epimerase